MSQEIPMLRAMTKAELIEQMAFYPDDTVLYAFNGDEGEVIPVTGLLYTPPRNPLDTDDKRIPGAYLPPTLEFCTDEP